MKAYLDDGYRQPPGTDYLPVEGKWMANKDGIIIHFIIGEENVSVKPRIKTICGEESQYRFPKTGSGIITCPECKRLMGNN